jgi:hypothetical protein
VLGREPTLGNAPYNNLCSSKVGLCSETSLEGRVRGRDKNLISICGSAAERQFSEDRDLLRPIRYQSQSWIVTLCRNCGDIALWIVRGTSDYGFQQFQIFHQSMKHYWFPDFFNGVLVIGALLSPFLVSFPSSAQSGLCCSYVKFPFFLSPPQLLPATIQGTLFSTP